MRSKLSPRTLTDTLSFFDGRILFTAGVHYQRIAVDVFKPDGSIAQAYDEQAVTPERWVGLDRPSEALQVLGGDGLLSLEPANAHLPHGRQLGGRRREPPAGEVFDVARSGVLRKTRGRDRNDENSVAPSLAWSRRVRLRQREDLFFAETVARHGPGRRTQLIPGGDSEGMSHHVIWIARIALCFREP
ncbi:hypothetical protein [Aquabacter cavernae]|uniref:hypothetical protein n=1 Tax=Aquabacter cavernae TaxID=2496029 RepID=UPI000F8D8D3B|nr:hypothetical protein [Aquabacter cavernae]